jgi:hypothetical protein
MAISSNCKHLDNEVDICFRPEHLHFIHQKWFHKVIEQIYVQLGNNKAAMRSGGQCVWSNS